MADREELHLVLDKQLHISVSVAPGGYPRLTIDTGATTVVLITEAEQQGRRMTQEDLQAAHAFSDTFGGFTHHVVRGLGTANI